MSDSDKIKVPRRASGSRVDKALTATPRDGNWHRLLEMGQTSAEQTARGYNVPNGQWLFGYTLESKTDGDIVSVLWGKWVNDD
jgi:hypothetical protein